MEPVTTILGLFELAVVTGRITSKLCNIISEVKELPESLRQELEWLGQLEEILLRFEGTCQELDSLKTSADIDLVYRHLKRCKKLVKNLETQVEKRLRKIRWIKGNFVQSRIEALSAVFKSDDFQRSKSDIDLCMKTLNFCYQEVSSRLSVEQYKSITRVDKSITRVEKDVKSMKQMLKSLMGTDARTLDKINGDHGLTVKPQQGGKFMKARDLVPNGPRPSELEYRLLIDNCQEPCRAADEFVVHFPIHENHTIDAGGGVYRTTDLSLPPTSTCIPRIHQHRGCITIKQFNDADSRLQLLYEDTFCSLPITPNSLDKALALYQTPSEHTTVPTVRQRIGLDALLKSYRDKLYTHTGSLEVKRWTSQLVNIALQGKLKLGTDLNSGVLYFDGPLKYSIWFEECCPESATLNSVVDFENGWYDELTSSTKFTYFKDWFDELIRYDAGQEPDDTPHPGSSVEKYLEPTLQAFLGGHLSPWLSALMDADMDVLEVARHTFAWATGQEAAFIVEWVQKKVKRTMKPWPRKYLLPSYCPRIQTTEELKEVMLVVFRENGIDLRVEDKSQDIDISSLSLLRLILLALASLTRNWNPDYVWLEDRRHVKEI